MILREPKNHSGDCCCCCWDVKGYNSKNKNVIFYPNFTSASHPVVHGPELPVPQPTEMLEDASTNSSDSGGDDEEFQCHTESQIPQLFTQSELNDVIRDRIAQGKSGNLRLQVERKEFLAAGTSMHWYRRREKEFKSYFSQDGDLAYCCNIAGLMQKFGVEYKVNEWRLFIDPSKRSLKAVFCTKTTTTLH
jgi:hypothetical protein